jgi:hypothetical protein
MAVPLSPENDLALVVTLKTVGSNGGVIPLTEATCTTFLTTSSAPTATAVGGLTGTVTETNTPGRYLVSYTAGTLAAATLATHFAAATPYLVVRQVNGFRVYVEMLYSAGREMLPV